MIHTKTLVLMYSLVDTKKTQYLVQYVIYENLHMYFFHPPSLWGLVQWTTHVISAYANHSIYSRCKGGIR